MPRTAPPPGRDDGVWEAVVLAVGALPDGVVVVDEVGRIVHANAQLEEISGHPVPELLGEPVEVLVPEGLRDLHRRERRSYVAHPRVRPMAAGRDLELRRRDGTRVPVDVSLAPLETAEGLLTIAVVRDATVRRATSDELLRRARLLGAVATVTERLLGSPGVEGELGWICEVIGRTVGAGRAAVFEVRPDRGGWSLARLWSWPAEARGPAGRRACWIGRDGRAWERWWSGLERAFVVEALASEVPAEGRWILDALGARSLLVAPISVEGHWWGGIGLADLRTERRWPEVDAGVLRSVAAAIGEALARERSLERLRESEARYRQLVERMPAVTYLCRPGDRGVVYVSGQVAELLGYPPEQFEAEPDLWVRILHPDDRPRVREAWRRANAEAAPFRLEYRCLARDGREVWVLDSSAPIRSGDELLWQGVLVDITTRVQAEEELRRSFEALRRVEAERRRLAEEIVHAGEAERVRLAADLHDDPVQRLTATQLRLELAARASSDPAVAGRLAASAEEVQGVIGSLRRMIREAHPPALERYGLAAALREYARELSEQHGFAVAVEADLAEEPPASVRRICYRLFQEALTNVAKHARASRVELRVAAGDGGIRGSLCDDGVGFDVSEAAERSEHAGIELMRKRAELFGGWLRVRSTPGVGTAVEWWLPIAGPGDPGEGRGATG